MRQCGCPSHGCQISSLPLRKCCSPRFKSRTCQQQNLWHLRFTDQIGPIYEYIEHLRMQWKEYFLPPQLEYVLTFYLHTVSEGRLGSSLLIHLNETFYD